MAPSMGRPRRWRTPGSIGRRSARWRIRSAISTASVSSRSRSHRVPRLPKPESVGLPDIEPRLIPALLRLPETQRAAVWLVHACEWRYAEVADALSTTTSMVGNHVARGMARLREELEVHAGA